MMVIITMYHSIIDDMFVLTIDIQTDTISFYYEVAFVCYLKIDTIVSLN